MRKVSRWVSNAATATSLILCVAALALWVRSEHHAECVTYNAETFDPDSGAEYQLYWSSGRIVLRVITGEVNNPGGWSAETVRDPARPVLFGNLKSSSFARRIGFGFDYSTDGTMPNYEWSAPIWCVVLATGFWPAARVLLSTRRRSKRLRGFCAACSYNLTGNVSGICPECGTPTGSMKNQVLPLP